jgi:hypothetical protein
MDIDRSANGGPPDREGRVTVIAVAWLRRPEKWGGGIGLDAFAEGPSGGCKI